MQFSVGDKVVHPYHGAGQITGLERKELLDEAKRYFVIDIPSHELTVWIPRSKMEQVGIRRHPGDHVVARHVERVELALRIAEHVPGR